MPQQSPYLVMLDTPDLINMVSSRHAYWCVCLNKTHHVMVVVHIRLNLIGLGPAFVVHKDFMV